MSWQLWFDRWAVTKGGPGSGHWGHAGRPGHHGGSAPGGGKHAAPEAYAAATGGVALPKLQVTDKKLKNVVTSTLQGLPSEHVGLLSGVSEEDLGKGIVGYASYSTGSIVLNPREGVGQGEIVHEVGHFVQMKGVSNDVRRDIYGLYTDAVREAGLTPGDIASHSWYGSDAPKGFPTGYAATNVAEFFAESYRLYVTDPGALKSASSEIYSYLKEQVFKGKEY